MKGIKRHLAAAAAACVLTLGLAGAACAGDNAYILKDGKTYRAGNDTPLDDMEPGSVNTKAGLWSWIKVDPEKSPAMNGTQQGVYFFRGDDAKPAGLIPIEEEVDSCRIYFCPSGERLLLSWGMEYAQHLSLYEVDPAKGYVKKISFEVQGPPIWIDPYRFAFTYVDPKKGLRAEGKFDCFWSSAAVYDSAVDLLTVLKQADALNNYILNGYFEDSDTFEVWRSTVKDEKDWADDDKIDEKELSVPVPAAG